jgi:hypothetical protein
MFCTQPFNHIDIIVENDKVMLQPCNVWSEDKYTMEGYKAGVASLQEALKTKFHNGCKICKNEEAQKIRSRRQATNEFAQDNKLSMTKLQSLGVRYGTLCNSKCMICGHSRSSSWVVDSEKLGYEIEEQHRFKKNLLPGVDVFFDNFDLGDLRYVEFHGGEPLMQLDELLKKCKRADFLLSVDDIGPRYEILRYPGKWGMFVNNMETLKQRGYRTMAYNTMSSLNIFYAVEFYKWAVKNFGNEVHSQFVVDKKHLDISYLPQHAKDCVLEQIANYKGKIFDSIRQKLNTNKEECSQELIKYILDLDGIRNTNYPETFKEWWTILNTK